MRKHIGLVLRHLREVRHMSPFSVVQAMAASGHVMSVAEYIEMEAGAFLPDDGEAFLNAYREAIHLSHDELALAVKQFACDYLRHELGDFGEDITRKFLD